jgi:hypothetical protein
LVGVAQDQPGHGAGRLSVQAREHVAVGVHGDGDGGVAQALADDLGRDASGQRRGRVAVSDVVEPDLGEAGRPGVLLEPSGEALRMDGLAIWPGEHQAGVLPARADCQPLLELPGAVLVERGDRRRIKRQRPAALGGLRLGDDNFVIDDYPRSAGRDTAGVQVHVSPAQPSDLAAAHAGGGEQQPSRVQRVIAHMLEEEAQLLWAPHMQLWCHALGQVSQDGNVAREVAPAHCVSECRMEHAVDVPDTLRSQPAAPVAPPIVQQLTVEHREVGRREPLQEQATERRDDVPLDGYAIAVPGGGPNPRRAHGRQPLVD